MLFLFIVDRAKFGSRLLGLRNVLCESLRYPFKLVVLFFAFSFFINDVRIITVTWVTRPYTYIALHLYTVQYTLQI